MSKLALDARVKFLAGPVAGSYGRIVHTNDAAWTADVRLDDGRVAKGVPAKHLEVIPEADVTDRDKLLDRVRKLLAKAASAKELGNEAEAATFAAGAQKMMAKYKLDMTEVEFTRMEQEEPIENEYVKGTKRHREQWSELLASIVARAHYCRILVIPGSDTIVLVGRTTDRAVAAYVYTTLRDFAERQSDKDARAFRRGQRRQIGATIGNNRNFRAAWLAGFVERIAQRYQAERDAMAREAKQAGTSLVRLDNAIVKVDEEIARRARAGQVGSAAGRARGRSSANDAGRAAGRAAGDAANIRGTGLGAGTTSKRNLLS
jgi:hypothetical protein